jgi:hypothetical protein
MKYPKNWMQVSIGMYAQLYELEQVRKDLDTYDYYGRKVSILCNIGEDEAMNVPMPDIKRILAATEFLSTPPENKFINEFVVGGKWFDVNPDMSAVSPAQFISHSTYTKDNINFWQNIHRVMSVWCIERGKTFKDQDNDEVAKLFWNELPMSVVFPLATFFLTVWEQLPETIQTYSSKTRTKLTKELTQYLRSENS